MAKTGTQKTREVSDEHYRLLIERMLKNEYILRCEEIALHAANELRDDADLYIVKEYRGKIDEAQAELKRIEARISEYEG